LSPHIAGEFFGTMILILLGGGVVAGVLLKETKSHGAGWMVITAAWAFAVACGIFTAKALGAPGALNPVGPLTDMIHGNATIADGCGMILAEVLGAFCGATLVWLHYYPHWKVTDNTDAKRAVFCTAPAIRHTPSNFLGEFLGTFALVFVASAIGKASIGSLEPSMVGMLVWGIGLSRGGTTGYAINPARDFGPRLAHALLPIAGKGNSDWAYAWIPILGPCAGAVVASFAFKAMTG
jgi:glycerol uptake facilitator protein